MLLFLFLIESLEQGTNLVLDIMTLSLISINSNLLIGYTLPLATF